jgi:hypothetical protein
MKRGVAGVRLCDTSGCYDRWPCARHGTLTVLPLRGRMIDLRICHLCGYQCCGCPIELEWRPDDGGLEKPADVLPDGWRLREGYLETYDRLGTDSVSGNLDGRWFLVRGGKSDYSRKFATRNAAMAAALSSANVCMMRWPDDQT